MPSKKKKYNARFPPARIKKIMQTDEEVGKVAAAVPVIISRALELFVESLLTKAVQITSARNAKTLSPAHLKQCILAESRFDFLKDLVLSIPDVQTEGDEGAASVPNTPVGLQPPPLFRSQLSNNEEGASSSSRGARRPRGRPRKTPVAVQRSWSSKSGKSATESDESDSAESEGSDEDEELSTDTDYVPKAAQGTVTNKNGDSGVPVANLQSSVQFNAVQPNFYQEINNAQVPFQIQIHLPPHETPAAVVANGVSQAVKEATVEDDDYDT